MAKKNVISIRGTLRAQKKVIYERHKDNEFDNMRSEISNRVIWIVNPLIILKKNAESFLYEKANKFHNKNVT